MAAFTIIKTLRVARNKSHAIPTLRKLCFAIWIFTFFLFVGIACLIQIVPGAKAHTKLLGPVLAYPGFLLMGTCYLIIFCVLRRNDANVNGSRYGILSFREKFSKNHIIDFST